MSYTFADLTQEQRFTLLYSATRYALGRSTRVGRDVADMVAGLAPELDPTDAKTLARNIIEQEVGNVSPFHWAAQWEAAVSALRQRAYTEAVKVSFNLLQEELDQLRALAEERVISVTHVIRQAIGTELFLAEQLEAGNKVLIETSEKDVRQLAFRKDARVPASREDEAS